MQSSKGMALVQAMLFWECLPGGASAVGSSAEPRHNRQWMCHRAPVPQWDRCLRLYQSLHSLHQVIHHPMHQPSRTMPKKEGLTF